MSFIKTLNRAIVPVLFFCGALSFSGCKKHYIKKHYTGTFEFTDQKHTWPPDHDTTLVYTGTISYITKDENGSNLKIQFSASSSVNVYANRDGSFLDQTYGLVSLTGGFTDDDHLEFTCTNGTSASGVADHVTGVRK
jgi:hypothetical protein